MNGKDTGVVIAECGDLMLAKECIADLRAARFAGDVSVSQPLNVDELERRGFLGFGTPAGESFSKGAALGTFLGIIAGAVLVAFATQLPVDSIVAVTILGSIGALIGGVTYLLRTRDHLDGSNNRAVMLRCRGDSTELLHAIAVLQHGPCQHVRQAC